MSSWKAYAAGISWASIFGLSFLVTKGALEAFSPATLLFLRFALAAAALGALALLGIVRLGYHGKPLAPLLLICLVQPILYFTLETYGLRETASSTAGLILGAMPAAVAALSVPMLKERLTARQCLGLALSMAGVVLIVVEGGRRSGPTAVAAAQGTSNGPLGVFLIVGALVSAAFYNVFSRKASTYYSPAETTFAMMASGAVFFGLLATIECASGGWASPFSGATPAAWGEIAYLGILSSVVAFFLVNLSLSRLKAAQASVFGTLTTLVSLVAGVAARGEPFGPVQAVGAAGIVAGVWMTNARRR
ncbi:MAG: EamA family transporter [Spirochaetae bacterium HGW-Spirochaetae-3]|jgi:drug/metabolite transporter (DMT)-like permease|nr:MAG: EamA family transporter [Spirochaetae bacterium HGW-Spirochaetae-3]